MWLMIYGCAVDIWKSLDFNLWFERMHLRWTSCTGYADCPNWKSVRVERNGIANIDYKMQSIASKVSKLILPRQKLLTDIDYDRSNMAEYAIGLHVAN